MCTTLIGLIALTGPAWAETVAPEVTIERVTQEIMETVRSRSETLKRDPAEVYALAEQIISPHIDYERMARLVLGKHWRNASPGQRREFTGEFRSLLLRFYSTAVSEYLSDHGVPEDVTVTYLPVTYRSDKRLATVRTLVNQDSGPAVPVDYEVYNAGGDWKIYDVKLDAISLIGNYRKSFSDEIQAKGLDSLIARLRSHNTETGGA